MGETKSEKRSEERLTAGWLLRSKVRSNSNDAFLLTLPFFSFMFDSSLPKTDRENTSTPSYLVITATDRTAEDETLEGRFRVQGRRSVPIYDVPRARLRKRGA